MNAALPWLVCGSAACLWRDLRALPFSPHDTTLVAVNGAALEPALRPACSVTLHFDESHWARKPWLPVFPIWSFHKENAVTDVLPQRDGWHGGSGLYGVQVALHQGAPSIILAGMPIDDGPRLDGRCSLVDDLEFYRAGWLFAEPELRGRVWSMSGWTRELLGGPPDELYTTGRRTAGRRQLQPDQPGERRHPVAGPGGSPA